jgi:hypothetical protein
MPFFTSKNKNATSETLQKLAASASIQTYADADYYIAEAETNYVQSFQFVIPEYTGEASNNSHDTTQVINESGPSDFRDSYSAYNVKASKLSIVHEPTKYAVMFPAIIDSYSETFTPSYESENLLGRMDPVQKYVATTRKISVSFTILAYDEDHAHRNIHALSTLAEFLYPVYDYNANALSNATAMREAPLWRVRFANLIQRTNRNKNHYISDGLLVAPNSFSFEPVLDAGFFIVDGSYTFPKQIKVSLSFSVLHEETLGWVYDTTAKKLKWNGNIDKNGFNNLKSTIFPWGDYSLGEVGESQEANQSALTAKAEIEIPEEE